MVGKVCPVCGSITLTAEDIEALRNAPGHADPVGEPGPEGVDGLSLEVDHLTAELEEKSKRLREGLPIVAELKAEVAREIFEEIKRSKVTLGYPAKIICFRATPMGIVEETVEGWVVPQSRIEELEKKYIGGKTDEGISD